MADTLTIVLNEICALALPLLLLKLLLQFVVLLVSVSFFLRLALAACQALAGLAHCKKRKEVTL